VARRRRTLADGLTCRQLLLLQQDGVGHPQLGQVVEGLTAKAAATYHNHISLRRDFLSSLLRRQAEGSTVRTSLPPWLEGLYEGGNISLAEHRHHDKD